MTSASLAKEIGGDGSDDGGKPLQRERHERFVNAYLETFDGETAAQKAGYRPAMARRVWPILLSVPKVVNRLKGLRWGGIVPNLEKSAVLKSLAEDAFADAQRTWLANPFTGQMVQCLARADSKFLKRVSTKTKVIRRGGVTSVIEELIVPGRPAEVGIIARALGLQSPPEDQSATSGFDRSRGKFRSMNANQYDNIAERLTRARMRADADDALMRGPTQPHAAPAETD